MKVWYLDYYDDDGLTYGTWLFKEDKPPSSARIVELIRGANKYENHAEEMAKAISDGIAFDGWNHIYLELKEVEG